MICFWNNNALCLRPEDDEELKALATLYLPSCGTQAAS